jgi:sortase A
MAATLLAVSFMSFTTPLPVTARPEEQAELYAQVPAALDPDSPPPVAAPAKGPGSALAYMTVARFGQHWLWTVVEGIELDQLDRGPGHYPGTPLMGAPGNFIVAAHRATHGDPFIDFDLLEVGDTVTFRQSGAWWQYVIHRGPEIIEPDETWVLNQPQRTDRRRLTLITCWPKYGSEKRMFVRGHLVDWSGKK